MVYRNDIRVSVHITSIINLHHVLFTVVLCGSGNKMDSNKGPRCLLCFFTVCSCLSVCFQYIIMTNLLTTSIKHNYSSAAHSRRGGQ
jgi:hypothetical protein